MTDRVAKLQGSSGASTAPETFVQGGAGTSGLSDFSALTTFIFPRRVRLRVGMGKGEGKSLLQVSDVAGAEAGEEGQAGERPASNTKGAEEEEEGEEEGKQAAKVAQAWPEGRLRMSDVAGATAGEEGQLGGRALCIEREGACGGGRERGEGGREGGSGSDVAGAEAGEEGQLGGRALCIEREGACGGGRGEEGRRGAKPCCGCCSDRLQSDQIAREGSAVREEDSK
uniref:Uncharacterized protein n=1 Tax=Chromera velia CCMP2878 TaxID=1169474 RepID=A0A0G4IE66_9ALVE|eukprot:Cvel_13504.t1-p1 / transcript=Cvel_13504.t1 / gene=Cvel_13504 / organism=Chromera_velia_CCMP2878 / gene_product=hypothetical protein / transcript_product=hypothetical protein / location=Cvel_scaffold925:27491-32047(+) / protein_length=226 / sequence_SO=supercontig / SO=protein_coding / is_pseudo=false